MDEKARLDNPSPLNDASFFSRLFINWISPLLKTGSEKPLDESDLYSPLDEQQSHFLTEQLEKEWNKELKESKNPSLTKALIKIHAPRFFLFSILSCVTETIRMSQPFIITQILRYFKNDMDLFTALEFGTLITLSVLISQSVFTPVFINHYMVGLKTRLACQGLMYKKLLRYKFCGKENESTGRIINLMTNDVSRFEKLVILLPYLFIAPVQALFIVFVLAELVDVHFLTGLGVLILFIPCQYVVSKLLDRLKRIIAKKCDKRLGILNEVLGGIKIIKMYCWENTFKKIIENIRGKEMRQQGFLFCVMTVNTVMTLAGPSLMLFVSTTVFVYYANLPLSSQYVILAMSYFMKINGTLGFFFIKQIQMLIAANVSLKRIQSFLMEDETVKANLYIKSKKPSVKFVNVSSSWTNKPDDYCLKDLNIEVNQNELLAVIGSVGSGKTSFLMTLLEEMKSIKGNLKVDGSVFYVQQEPWIFSASLRQNITFGKPYIRAKFNEIIKACCLEQDMKILENGEKTLIGEKGINLSGGQRARVGLARALYSDAQILLLDDPLSAVDANVAKHLFNECINGYMKNKIRILITHQIHYLTDVNNIIFLQDGKIKASGSFNQLASFGINIDQIHKEYEQEKDKLRKNSVVSIKTLNNDLNSIIDKSEFSDNEDNVSLINDQINVCADHYESRLSLNVKNQNEFKENRTEGALTLKTYFAYFKSGGGVFGLVFFFSVLIISQILMAVGDYWINYWATMETKDYSDNYKLMLNKTLVSSNQTCDQQNCIDAIDLPIFKDRFSFHRILAYLNFSGIFMILVACGSFNYICLQASKNLHKKMFNSVMVSPVRFFDLNPLGRIMNRFSKDIGLVDEEVPWTVYDFVQLSVMIISSIVIAVTINYWIIAALIPLSIALYFIRKYYLSTSIEIKRIDGINRSPIYIHLSNTISGITTIRASKIQNKLYEEFNAQSDYHTRAASNYIYVTRWFSCRLDWLAACFMFVSVISCILLKDFLRISPDQVGVLLVYLFRMLPMFQWCCRQSCEVENLMTSVERILEYTALDSEPLETGKIKAETNWPKSGAIKFKNVNFKYSSELPNVLNDLSFEIKPQEKIGVVGRTGAGKSSIIQALFRMAEPSGSILIDDVNIRDLSLHDLRKKLSIIPQEPTIFIGTIRSNLDPFNEHTDKELWDSLKKVQLEETIQDMQGGLESNVQKGGSNLSVGQKQLICLARAIVRKSKVLIIDEATAHVDFKTDSLIQTAIRDSFKECTVITIAHRLQTIIDCDRIMCLDKGQLQDFGQPYDLLRNESTILHDLVYSLEETEKYKLIETAKKNSKK